MDGFQGSRLGAGGEVGYNTGEGDVLCCVLSGDGAVGIEVGTGGAGAVGTDSRIGGALGSDVSVGCTLGSDAGVCGILGVLGVGSTLGSEVDGGTDAAFFLAFL